MFDILKNTQKTKKNSMIDFRKQAIRNFVRLIKSVGIELVCFDFDETITVNGKRFVSNTFRMLVDELTRNGIHLAIATFNMGYDIQSLLVRKQVMKPGVPFPIFRRVLPQDFVMGKYWHICQAMTFFKLPLQDTKRVLLVDDVQNNVEWARRFGICALEVQRRRGLSLDDLLRCIANAGFYFPHAIYRPKRFFVPSLGKFLKEEQSHVHLIKKLRDLNLLDRDAMDNLYLLERKDLFGHPYLLAIKFKPAPDKSKFDVEFPFIVVSPKIITFLNQMTENLLTP